MSVHDIIMYIKKRRIMRVIEGKTIKFLVVCLSVHSHRHQMKLAAQILRFQSSNLKCCYV